MGSVPSQPVAQNLAGLWGGQGFGGMGSPGAVPPPNAPGSMPGTYLPVTPPQNLQPVPGANPGNMSDFNYAAPGTTGGGQQTIPGGAPQASLWSKLLGALGSMPKPNSGPGSPSLQTPPSPQVAPPPSMMMPGQTGAPPGMGAYFRAMQTPPAPGGGNNTLMAQYAALQQLMRGA